MKLLEPWPQNNDFGHGSYRTFSVGCSWEAKWKNPSQRCIREDSGEFGGVHRRGIREQNSSTIIRHLQSIINGSIYSKGRSYIKKYGHIEEHNKKIYFVSLFHAILVSNFFLPFYSTSLGDKQGGLPCLPRRKRMIFCHRIRFGSEAANCANAASCSAGGRSTFVPVACSCCTSKRAQ